jgi:hypothetical protein
MNMAKYLMWWTETPLPYEEFLRRKAAQPALSPSGPFDDRDDALAAARIARENLLGVHLIEGDDGTALRLPEIRELIKERGRALDGRPRPRSAMAHQHDW